jgi:uncharacterized protein (DUF983 family)
MRQQSEEGNVTGPADAIGVSGKASSTRLSVLLARACRLRCPRCGLAPIFHGWFTMHDRCSACGRRFNRSPGYFLGSIYFNYGVTAVIVVVAYFSFYFSETMSGTRLLALLTAFIIVFPLWFFRYARALWIAFDEALDPWPNGEERQRGERDARQVPT